ncbi:MgtC/SapB family protein [bacterium]|nr:MgtC/SapB family protein [bacterium]
MVTMSPEYIDLAIKLLIATLLSGLVGLEREFHGRAAGLRTHILVCLGATIIMASSQTVQNLFTLQGAESVIRIDPWRIAAGILTGIGFLGGGTILKTNDLISGLTTAACIWFIASIGIIVGLGLYIPAIMGTFIGLLVLIGLDPIDHRIPSVKYSQITIISEMETAEEVETQCLEILKKNNILVQDTAISADATTRKRTLVMSVRSRGLKNKYQILKQIFSIPHIEHIDW